MQVPIDRAGVGFKPNYFEELMTKNHTIGWFEIHAENYMLDGGPVRRQLEHLRQSYPVSCHGVGLGFTQDLTADLWSIGFAIRKLPAQ